MMTIIFIFGVVAVLLFQIQLETISSSESFENSDKISKTGINILDINASSSSLLVNFTFINQGSEKLWNYDEFDVLVTYDANVLGKRTPVTEKFTFNATASEESPGQAVPSRDFKIQRGELIMLNTELTSTITEAVEFEECVGDCFIKLVNSRLTGNGQTSGGESVEADDLTTYISNDEGLRSGGLSTVTFERHGTEGDIRDNRLQWEIWEYIGKNETGNQIIVWDTGTCTYTGSSAICDGASIPEFTGTDDRVVVFITGQANPQDNLGNFPDCMNTSEWLGGSNIPRLSRIGAGSTVCDVSYAVVEFSGSNWSVQRIEHIFTNAILQIEPISDVGDINKAFFHYQQRTEDSSSSDDTSDLGPEVQLLNSSSITYGLPQTQGGWDSSMESVTWIISNSNTYSSEKIIVDHLNPVERPSGGAEEENWQVAITSLTRDTSETVIAGLTAQTSSTGASYPRGFISAILTDSTTATFYQADTGHTLEYTFQIVQLPRSQKCVDGKSFIIEAGEWTINCIMYDDFEPGILNPNEVAEVMLKLDYPIFTNGFLEFSISTDNGNSATKTSKAT